MKQDTNLEQKFFQRFINDFKLPIFLPLTRDMFEIKLKNYNGDIWHLYQHQLNYINNDLGGDIALYLDEYYNVRDFLVKCITSNPAYQAVNNDPDIRDKCSKLVLCEPLKNKLHKNLYNEENINKYFISIDIKEANFSAMSFINPAIFSYATDYKDWLALKIPQYLDQHAREHWVEYFKLSKYIRQVVFGQANPKLHIALEKYILVSVCNKFFELCPESIANKLTVDIFNVDEVIFTISETEFNDDDFITSIRQLWYDAANIVQWDADNFNLKNIFKFSKFKLFGYDLINETYDIKLQTFYIKSSKIDRYYMLNGRYELMVHDIMSNNDDYTTKNISRPDLLEVCIDNINYKIQDTLRIKQR